jgi:site-specific DNA recombinase
VFIDEGHAGIVRRIFDLYTGTDSLSLMATTDLLNLEGVPSPKGGKCWYKATVKAIVSNPIYIGHVRFSGYVAIFRSWR